MTDINELLIRGYIINKYSPQTASGLDIVILTMNVPSKKSNLPNYPKVVFYGDMAKEADKFKLYDNIEIVAEIQTHRKIVDGNKTYTQNIVGQSIKETDKTLSTAFEADLGGGYIAPENQLKLKGTVRQCYLITDNVLSITIETYINGRHNFIRTFMYGNKAKKFVSTLVPDTQVVALGEVQTLKKTKGTETLYFENIVIKEIKPV